MSKRQLLILFGALIMVLPYLGFPESWRKIFALAIGALIIIVAYKVKSDTVTSHSSPSDLPYVENRNE